MKKQLQAEELALFCSMCPQPAVNLPDDWKTKFSANEIMWSFIVDGNFTTDHLRQKNAADNVWLSEGLGMMTTHHLYAEYLKIVTDICDSNFCAIDEANQSSPLKDVTGVVGHACACHGCYCPRSLVDLQKGERQANIDWSLCEALTGSNLNGIPKMLLIYDINCQYHVKLQACVNRNRYLSLPPVELEKAIGQFHVHGHQDTCLYRYSMSYIPGASVVDGEVMETLWSVLNNILQSTCTATLAHQAEILDDHMNDLNWKKLTNSVLTVLWKFRRASLNLPISEEYYNKLTASASQESVDKWEQEIHAAEAGRIRNPKKMDIMNANIPKPPFLTAQALLSSAAECLLEAGATAWIATGLKIEVQQLEVIQLVDRCACAPTLAKQTTIAKKREQLTSLIAKFSADSTCFLHSDVHPEEPDAMVLEPDTLSDDSDGLEYGDASGNDADTFAPEQVKIPLPSNLDDDVRVATLVQMELELRKGHANNCLEGIRISIGQCSFHFAKEPLL